MTPSTSTSAKKKLRLVCLSDTHNAAPGEGYTLPRGDILIHAGDLTNQGSYAELEKAVAWIQKADFAVKIVVAGMYARQKGDSNGEADKAAYLGNHDLSLDPQYSLKHKQGWRVQPGDVDNVEKCRKLLREAKGITYLEHESTVVHLPEKDNNISVRIFGSPYSPAPERSTQNWAFQYQYEHEQAEALWNPIPTETEILITHTPPKGFCDASAHWKEGGCAFLFQKLSRVRPLLHICGHCHEGREAEIVRWGDEDRDQDHDAGAVVHSVESTRMWHDPGAGVGNKKQSLLDLTGARGGDVPAQQRGKETAIVNASITAHSFGRGGAKAFHKPIVVDVLMPVNPISGDMAVEDRSVIKDHAVI
jgi:Icc-related predicted phosphoesterase